jgi:hypothetical protein
MSRLSGALRVCPGIFIIFISSSNNSTASFGGLWLPSYVRVAYLHFFGISLSVFDLLPNTSMSQTILVVLREGFFPHTDFNSLEMNKFIRNVFGDA